HRLRLIDSNCILLKMSISRGLAGEVLQKFINYGGRIAIYGDYSRYTSKPLKDFIRESNNGRDVFFTATEDEAVDMLTR
ncbi:MAG: DUF4180 domain-containing protein, partial [Oscillospiraceae bacterium]|nr:DUF4180 domain-containing protein [Oscillospiraceae bacterium]